MPCCVGRCWLDKDEEATEQGMKRGVQGSKHYLLFLTKVTLAACNRRLADNGNGGPSFAGSALGLLGRTGLQ